jgi:hypothetical protein
MGYAGGGTAVNRTLLRVLPILSTGLLLTACVTATVDEMVFNEPTEGIGDASVVILGRRHASDYETEPGFIKCVGKHITARDKSITVIGELEFINALYPWFEPRTAPLRPEDIDRLMLQEPVAEKLAELKTEYMIWIDGSTVRGDSAGSMTCGIGPGGAGCFGFGTWSNTSEYEAVIWDFTDRIEVGRVNTTATGQSYMPAIVIPIPIIAPVQGTACDGLGDQLLEFLSSEY